MLILHKANKNGIVCNGFLWIYWNMTERTQIPVSKELKKLFKKEAAERGVSMIELMDEVYGSYLQAIGKERRKGKEEEQKELFGNDERPS